MEYDNFIIIFSAPSGSGKSTIAKKLIEWQSNIKLSVSATTRQPRGEEQNGVDYYFLTKEEFEKKIENDEFVEYAKVHDNYYGTLKSQLEDKLNNGNDVILDIDWQGARQVSDQFDLTKLLKIFILPPSYTELENRLTSRGTDSAEVIQKRLKKSIDEVQHCNEYEYIVVNNNLETAFQQIKSIVEARRIRSLKQESLENFITQFENHK